MENVVCSVTYYLIRFWELSWIENSTIASRGAGGGITAWKGTPDGYAGVFNNTYGLYVHSSQLIKVWEHI